MENKIIHGDSLEVLKTLEDNSVDAVVTDPPYGLSFMGKKWDYDVPSVELWAECLRVLKPGGYLLAFAGTRTQHRMAVRIEDAGFEIRDMIAWVYSTGFPKSLNIKKQLEKLYGTTQKSEHRVRPMSEANISQTESPKEEQGEVLQSPMQEQGVSLSREASSDEGGQESSLEGWSDTEKTEGELQECPLCQMPAGVSTNGEKGRLHNGTQVDNGEISRKDDDANRSGSSHRSQSGKQRPIQFDAICDQCRTQTLRRSDGFGTALKPALEPITVARKPLSEKSVAENVLRWGTGGINIDECRVPTNEKLSIGSNSGGLYEGGLKGEQNGQNELGRFPANLIHDGSDEVVELFPNDNARFFYCAKASKAERNRGVESFDIPEYRWNNGGEMKQITGKKGNFHPTVKPIALMEYLVKLVSREGAVVLDPFLGSGTTAIACKNLGRKYIGIEREAEYIKIAEARLSDIQPTLLTS